MREEKPGVSEDSGVVKQSERADVNMENKFRIGIAGCGGMGSGHAIALKSGTGDTVYNGNVADAKMPDSAISTSHARPGQGNKGFLSMRIMRRCSRMRVWMRF